MIEEHYRALVYMNKQELVRDHRLLSNYCCRKVIRDLIKSLFKLEILDE